MGRDFLKNGVGVVQHTLVLKPDDGEALRPEVGIAFRVVLLACGFGMRFAIALHHQLRLVAEEVAKVFPELVLPPELRAHHLPIPQQLPKHVFRRSLVPPQLPRLVGQS